MTVAQSTAQPYLSLIYPALSQSQVGSKLSVISYVGQASKTKSFGFRWVLIIMSLNGTNLTSSHLRGISITILKIESF